MPAVFNCNMQDVPELILHFHGPGWGSELRPKNCPTDLANAFCYQVHSCHGHYHGNHQIDSLPEVPRLCRTLAYSVLCTCTHLSILLPPLGLMHFYHYVITVMITCTNQRISLQS